MLLSLVKAKRKLAREASKNMQDSSSPVLFDNSFCTSHWAGRQSNSRGAGVDGKAGWHAARGEQGHTRGLTLHLQVHLAHLREAVPQVHWKLLNHCQRESPSEGRGQRRTDAPTSLRACVRRGGSRETAAQSEAASYREKETSPASPSLPPSRLSVHSRSRPPVPPAAPASAAHSLSR